MANVDYDGLNPEELLLIDAALQSTPDNWANIALQIQDDLKEGKIGKFESSSAQEVAKLDRIISQNIDPGSPDRLFPQFQVDSKGTITFTPQEHHLQRKVLNHQDHPLNSSAR
jgi:hypothetical protein